MPLSTDFLTGRVAYRRQRQCSCVRVRVQPSAELLELAAAQAGVISRQQAERFGLGRNSLQRLVSEGGWQRLAQGLVLTRHGEPDWDAWAWAGVLRAGDRARLAGRSAAYLEGLITEPPEPIDILHPHGLHRPRTPHWVFHQEREGVRRMTSVGSPPRTWIEDTVLDLASTTLGAGDRHDPLHWLSLAVQQRLTTTDRLLEGVHRRRRIAGRGELSEILGDVEDGAQSPLEYYYLRDVEQAHGLPRGRRQAPVRLERRRLWRDVYYEEFRLLVELDGETGHSGLDRFRDYRRDNAALMSGDATLRYGWHDVRRASCEVAGQVAVLLIRGGWQGTPTSCPRCPSGLGDRNLLRVCS